MTSVAERREATFTLMGRDPRLRNTLSENDLRQMTSVGWFPRTNIPELEQIRKQHEALIARRNELREATQRVKERFLAEDKARQDELDAAYREDREPKKVKRTPEAERKEAIEEAEAHASAAAKAALDFAYTAVAELSGELPPGWPSVDAVHSSRVPPNGVGAKVLADIRSKEHKLRDAVEEAQRTIANAQREMLELHPLKHWLVCNSNQAHGRMLSATTLEVPKAYTDMVKPRDLHVPNWYGADADATPVEIGSPGTEGIVLPALPGNINSPDAEVALKRLDAELSQEVVDQMLAYNAMEREELVAMAKDLELTVTRADGRADLPPLKEDLARAIAVYEHDEIAKIKAGE